MKTLLLFAVLCLLDVSSVCSQVVDTIRANPVSQPLRRVWETGGAPGDRVGADFFSLGDIFAVGREAWFIGAARRDAAHKGLYLWDSVTEAARQVQQGLPVAYLGCSGRFFGGEKRYAVLATGYGYRDIVPVPLMLLVESKSDTLNVSTPLSTWDGGKQTPVESVYPDALAAADLDGDGADDLVVLFAGSSWPVFDSTGQLIGYEGDGRPRFLVWRGGPNFSLESPSMVVLDSLSLSTHAAPVRLIVGSLDSDSLPDVATVFEYRIDGRDSSLLNVWLSSSDSVWNWAQPTRRIAFPDAYGRFGYDLTAVDLDGDHQLDLGLLAALNGSNAAPFYLSRGGKSILTRSFTAADADVTLISRSYLELQSWGYISDSSGRYGMLALGRLNYYGFSGGPNGPDAEWDATASGVVNWEPMGDATGDGWDDVLAAYGGGSSGDGGYAALYAGGPYIPHDPTVGVEWSAIAGERARSLAVWPQPARELLHIAWRGDLRRMPESFRIVDDRGELVAQGDVAGGRGEVVWDCSGRASGSYTCVVHAVDGATLATVRLIVEH